MLSRIFTTFLVATLAVTLGACTNQQSRATSSVVDFLYPEASEVNIEPSTPVLHLPLRVGIVFVPDVRSDTRGIDLMGHTRQPSELLAGHQRELLERIGKHFSEYDFVRRVEVIPTAYLRPGGSFTNLDQLRAMYGVDVVALVSFDQVQFTDQSRLSLTYWTLVGAYVIAGEQNDTHTMMDTAVYDIASRQMLFRAPGLSNIKSEAAPINLAESLRGDSTQGFEKATDNMIENLQAELERFVLRLEEEPERVQIAQSPDYGGAGALGKLSFLGLIFLLLGRLYSRHHQKS